MTISLRISATHTRRPGRTVGGPSSGRARRRVIAELVPDIPPIVDVGCDHGHVTASLGAVGTERLPGRLPRRRDIQLVVADGLSCFRKVGVAVITGIGAWQIARILARGPRPALAVVHAPDRPGWLRLWCASNGWRIDAEALAPEAGRFAEVTRIVPGLEPHRGLLLEFGPLLLEDPLLAAHAGQLHGHWARILEATRGRAPHKWALARRWMEFLEPMMPTTGDQSIRGLKLPTNDGTEEKRK